MKETYTATGSTYDEEVTFEPMPIEEDNFKALTVKELLDTIQKKLDEGTITEDTKVFSHVYLEPGLAYEYNEICVDNVDGLDFDVDGETMVDYILSEFSHKLWIRTDEKLPDSYGDYLICRRYGDTVCTCPMEATFDPKEKVFSYWSDYDDCEVTVKPEEVEVWMKVPEYKLEKEDEI